MGNTDGIMEAMRSSGKNKVIKFSGGYFSFAFGNEIALCFDGNYFTLNCDYHLWEIVKETVNKTQDKKKLIKWWNEQSQNFEINTWSDDFNLMFPQTCEIK